MNNLIAKITTRNETAGTKTTASLALAMVLLLSLAGCTVQLGQAQQIDPHAGGISVPVRVLHYDGGATLVLLSVTINDHGPYTFIVDTGAEV
ncbi:MAG: hypothetical protein ACXWQ5_21125, partial [Ktedonobacterales bacterium]